MTILRAFTDVPTLTLANLARVVDLSEATTLRYVSSLVAHGLLERDETTKEYRLGIGLFQLGQHALRGRDPRERALPYMKQLHTRFDETVNLALVNRGQLILIESLESERSLRKGAAIGDSDYWHSSGLGKAILADMPEEVARALLTAHPLPRLTDTTIVSVDELMIHLSLIRSRGYAIDDEETEEDLRCVACAIRDVRGEPVFALSVAGLASRMVGERMREIGMAVADAAAQISAELGYIDPDEEGRRR